MIDRRLHDLITRQRCMTNHLMSTLMVLLDTGIRLSELLDIRTDRMNLTESCAQVSGKSEC